MALINKPQWWTKLSNFYSFPNDANSTIDSDQLLMSLDDYVEGALAQIMSTGFQSTMGSVLKAAPGSIASSNILIPTTDNAELVLGFGGIDYLSGTTQDNVLHGGTGNDYFNGSVGIDFIIGSDETPNIHEQDTIAYLMAASGITVQVTQDDSSVAPNLFANQQVYSISYADFLDGIGPRVFGFQTGAGGDIVDVSALLAQVGYVGTDPVADGYVRLIQSGSDLRINFDPDGTASGLSKEIIRLTGISSVNFSIAHNLVTSPVSVVTGEPNYLTYVSNDGQGAYDVLYSVENIIGSRFDDTIYGHTIQNNLLSGAAGDDFLSGEGGADTLIGGIGHDTVYGGSGNDLIVIGEGGDQAYGGTGIDSFKFDGTISAQISENTATIWDFETGVGGDKIDVAEILLSAGYAGSDALADGYVQIVQAGLDTNIVIDMDGLAGEGAAQTLAVLKDTDSTLFSTVNNLVTAGPKVLYLSILGQSNAEGLRVLGEDSVSGVTRIHDGLKAQTNYNQVAVEYRDENNSVYVPAIGSTRVNGDYGGKTSDSWWYPSTNKPGEILIRAVEMLTAQIAEARANGAVKPVVIWGQGEGDCVYIGAQTTEAGRLNAQNVYKNATLAVFDYIKQQIGDDITFYIMETGRYGYDAAIAGGTSVATANRTRDGLPYIQAAQEQMVIERPDIFLATKYTDLPMAYEYDPVESGTDAWHFHPETREIIGDRIADFIALNLGHDHVLDNPGDYPIALLSDLNLIKHPGMTVNGNANNNIVAGTLGDDTLTGGGGNDTLYGGAGFDTVEYTLNFADYALSQATYLAVQALSGSEGTDKLMAVERVVFADGTYENGVFTPYANTPPVAKDDVFSGDQDVSINGNLIADNGNGVDSDPNSDAISIVAGVYLTQHGTVSIDANGDFTYTPDTGFFGIDSFDYILVDDRGDTDIGTAFLTVNEVIPPPPNTPPVAQDDIFSGLENANILGNVLADNGLGADSDLDGDTLSVVAGTVGTEHGSVTLSADGSFVYTPDENYFGEDSFSYTVQDGRGGSDVALVSLTIEEVVLPPNTPPVANDDVFVGNQDTSINGNLIVDNGNGTDSDPDSDPISIVAGVYDTLHGSVTIDTNGDFSYAPDAGFFGVDSFDYMLVDSRGDTDIGTAFITVNEVINTPPVAADDVFTGMQDVFVSGNLLANNGNGVDYDTDNNTLNVIAGVYGTAHGSVTISSNGDFNYAPNAGFYGVDSFDYTLSDGQGGTDTGSVFLTLSQAPENTAPVAQDDVFTGVRNTAIAGNLLANNGHGVDSDINGDALSVTAGIFATASGSITIAADGAFTYTSNSNFVGSDSFMYTISDGHGGNDTGLASFTINIPETIGTVNKDTITGTALDDIIRGLGGDDFLSGELGNDAMYGDQGNDTLKGRDGNDTLYGGEGADYLEGNNGNDMLYGGLGADQLKGSSGADTFVFTSILEAGDTIQDFNRASGDKIDISSVLEMYDPLAHVITDFVSISVNGANSVLSVDIDGGANGFVSLLTISNVTNLTNVQDIVNTGVLIV